MRVFGVQWSRALGLVCGMALNPHALLSTNLKECCCFDTVMNDNGDSLNYRKSALAQKFVVTHMFIISRTSWCMSKASHNQIVELLQRRCFHS